MGQEHDDYGDHPTGSRRPSRPWTLAQVAVVVLITLISVPLAFLVLIGVGLALMMH